ncbi:hypothetical protein DFQ28_011174 [Apophysomyces sp. BC1034]|nr:hypothetical protein DFQ29_002981 [Apophysomyces sp. BC1021]KAG0191699.1 hypothetical protein DFQ28_011174 [Apophysomyces sp. BC1034]
MKLSQLISLSSTATLFLQYGSFVQASPIFPLNYPHADELPDAGACEEFRITYPAVSGMQYEQHSKHIVAWQAPKGLGQVDLSLVKSSGDANIQNIGVYDGAHGVSDEFEFTAPSDPYEAGELIPSTGEYRFHLKAQSGQSTCELDSQPFEIIVGSEKISADNLDALISSLEHGSPSKPEDIQQLDALISSLEHGSPSQPEDNQQLDKLIQSLNQGGEAGHNNAINQDLASELQQLSGAHDNDYFTNEDQRNPATHADGFSVEEHTDDDAKDWSDISVPDHSNDGEWQAQELDTVNFSELDEDDIEDDLHDNDGDWTSAQLNDGEWHSNEISVDQDKSIAEHVNEWFDDILPDHSNEGTWHADEVADDEGHSNLALGNWVDDEAGHSNLAQGNWIDDEAGHSNLAQGNWIDDEASHSNLAQGNWVDREAGHSNLVQGNWVDREAGHSNLVQGNWVDREAGHSNLAQGNWVDKSHNNAVGWTDEGDAEHKNNIPIFEAESFIANW